ncbi:MAG: hypothetical protein MJY83_04950 [Bacteroidales bacterium]|nr:hypothetical protein [Bacteroidales bacterium]
MDRKLINPSIVTGIADAIREKGGTTDKLKVSDLPEAIRNLPQGGGIGNDTDALLSAIGVEPREDTSLSNALAYAMTDSALESEWSGERVVADGASIKDGVAFVERLKGKTIMKEEELVSFAPVAIVSKGRNLWDESTNLKGQWISVGGTISSTQNAQATKKIPCEAGDAFTIQADFKSLASNNIVCIAFYDDADVLMLRVVSSNKERCVVSGVAPKDATYVRGAHYQMIPKSIQLERGDFATDYVPHTAPTALNFDLTTIVDAQGITLFPDGELKSAGSIHDEIDYAKNVAIKRVGSVDLGKQNYYGIVASSGLFATNIADILDSRSFPTTYFPNLICSDSKYIIGSQYTWQKTDYQISGNNNTNHSILVKNKDIFDPLELKASLTGVTLNYELADPIQVPIQATKAWYPAQNNGSEELITGTIVPFGGEIRYRGM